MSFSVTSTLSKRATFSYANPSYQYLVYRDWRLVGIYEVELVRGESIAISTISESPAYAPKGGREALALQLMHTYDADYRVTWDSQDSVTLLELANSRAKSAQTPKSKKPPELLLERRVL